MQLAGAELKHAHCNASICQRHEEMNKSTWSQCGAVKKISVDRAGDVDGMQPRQEINAARRLAEQNRKPRKAFVIFYF
jgi:hypothetical protein